MRGPASSKMSVNVQYDMEVAVAPMFFILSRMKAAL